MLSTKGKALRGGFSFLLFSFDLLNSLIYDLKRSVDLRCRFDHVLHSFIDDLVFFTKERGLPDMNEYCL